jgi:hypothetical protein
VDNTEHASKAVHTIFFIYSPKLRYNLILVES